MMTCRAITGAGLALALAGLVLIAGCDEPADARRITYRSGEATRSALLVPAAGDRPAPLLVAFHGLGSSGADLMAALGDFPARSGASVVAPDALPCAPLGGVPCWPAEADAPAGPELAAFDDLVAAASRQAPVDPGRVYVLGLSNGGGWAVRLLLSRPRAVRGALVLAGYDPTRPYAREPGGIALPLRPTGPSQARAPVARRPVTLVHGDADGTVPAELARGLRARLLELGWPDRDVRLELIPGGGHDAPGLLDADLTLRRWRVLSGT